MVLQNIVWKNEEIKETTELYYHANSELLFVGGKLQLPAGTTIRFDTYFNVFLAKNWLRYTKIKRVQFRIGISGEGEIYLLGAEKENNFVQKFVGKQEVIFQANLTESPYYFFEIRTSKNSVLEYGVVETEEKEKSVKLALATCTYNRQRDIKRNIVLLKTENVMSREGPVLEQIYVVDNASNLEKAEIESDRIHLIPNKNTGGSGGFTRGLQEALKMEDITHIILMDDDVHIEFEAFRRTKAFLSYMKEEYTDYFLGGAMFRTDKPYILHAAGEDWADGHIKNVYKSTDMRRFEQVLKTSDPVETEQAYAGWWYCCIPRSHVEQKGYPMPFFLHCDDVEYSLRSGKPPIYLNGISVWHEEFEDKRSSVIEYYDTRNRLITNAIYKKRGKKRDALYILCERFYATVFRYRYRDFALSVKAVEDFLKGTQWLKAVDAEALHKTLLDYGYQWHEVQELPEDEEYPAGNKLFTIMKYFIPAKGRAVIRMGAPVSAYAGKKQVLLVEPKSGKGVEVRKNWREMVRCFGKLVKVWFDLIHRYSAKTWENRNFSMKAVYIVSTYYHALISCVKQLKQRINVDLVITAYIPDGKNLAKKIRESGLFCEVIYIDEIKEYKAKNRMDFYLNFHDKNVELIESQISVDFQKYIDVYVFHDDIWASRYFKDKGLDYHLIEDALDCFKTMSSYAFAYMLPRDGVKEKIKRLLNIGYAYCGLDPHTISVEVNEKQGIEIEKVAGEKIKEVPRKKLFAELSDEDIAVIRTIFAKEIPEYKANESVLILTRALYTDGIVESVEEQINMHKEIVSQNVRKGEQIVVKPHPRDVVDYAKIFPGAIILDKNMPAEIMPYMGVGKYKRIIAFYTTIIDGLTANEYVYKELPKGGRKENYGEND